MDRILSLDQLHTGDAVTLRSVGGPRSYRRRLLELGFVPGTQLRLVRRVPLGNVLEVELRHSRITLRITEARDIVVETGR